MAHTNYVVVRDQGQWKISLKGVHYGPYATQRDAVRAAVEAAHEAGRMGLNAKSCFGIRSASSGPTEKTRIRRTAQTSLALETPVIRWGVQYGG